MTRTRIFWGALSLALFGLTIISSKLAESPWAMPYIEGKLPDGSTVGFHCAYDCHPSGVQIALGIIGLATLLLSIVTLLICIRAPWK